MVRTGDEHTDRTEATSDTNKKKREPGRLTPMPDWLMKWWIPFALAGVLFCGTMFITSIWGTATLDEILNAIQDSPKRWPFHMRTPSREEIEVCLTITGAGFAFSAWQQKSHDNATMEKEQAQAQSELEADRQEREQNRLEQIERDEYWKRREHIFQLLTSKNPALRLSAIELLAELADTAEKSKLLNNSTKRQLQRHIVDTLCHQLRHEGLDHANDGDNIEHANIQESILRVIFTRINMYSDSKYCADWHTALIKIEDTNILTPITLTNITTEATLDLNSATFHEAVSIQNTKLRSLFWERAKFLSTLTVGSDSLYTKEQPSVTLGTGAIPTQVTTATFNDVTFITEYPFFIIQPHTPSTNGHIPEIYLKQCRFINTRCHCTSQCQCRKQHTENQCLCLISNKCTCNRICINSQVSFVEAMDHTAADQQAFFSLQNSQTGRIFLTNTARTPFITLKGNHITDQIFIFYPMHANRNPGHKSIFTIIQFSSETYSPSQLR